MKSVAVLCIALIMILPLVFAVRLGPDAKVSPKKAREFSGLKGIAGVSVEPPEKVYGPVKPFGRPRPKKIEQLALLPSHYKGLSGIAGPGPGLTQLPCAGFGCRPGKNIVANSVTKEYYRCYCAGAGQVPKENLACIDTPALAERMGYFAGKC